ncbi:MAG: hypothetical protein KZQ85_02865 [Candidatus Thiodiazotropha sp. (ex Myrtea sp. 'scaly one' KF741663)]|nr:hypothetical protein [Candidatus Thiodiazotropha sp. (ex Myrtea sp. 'scaly one' KF741663)]
MIEQEVIILRNVYDHIGEMVNFSLMDIQGRDPNSMIMFKDMNQRKLFFILLVDFLSVTDKRGPIVQTSFLGGLLRVCENPQFSEADSEKGLKEVVIRFKVWLQEKRIIDIWMPSISEEVKLSISRLDAIKMSGDVSKHNYLRASGVALRLQEILKESGVSVETEQAMLALPDFYERFHDDILIYLSSHICEFLNDIRWAIHTYLRPEFSKSFHRTSSSVIDYSYHVPKEIQSEYARDCYWELMNELRRKPYMRQFVVSESFKSEY